MSAWCDSDLTRDDKELDYFEGVDEFLEMTRNAAVISFDFFDTLYVRPLAHPEDAFDIIGKKYGIADFRSLRRAAQSEAFRRMAAAGKREITLEGIYQCLAECGTSSGILMQEEYDLELALVEPNPEVMSMFKKLMKDGRTVVVTSDMYLPESFFKAALRPCGLDTIPLFISSDCNATKRDSGELFTLLAHRLNVPITKILHIGDNELGDVTRPLEIGAQAFHYRPSAQRRCSKNICLATSAAYGLLNTSNRSIPPDSYQELGFIYGGAANLGFMQWIKAAALKDNIDHVLFLSRDGYSLESMTGEHWGAGYPKHSYFLGSRTAYTLAAITEVNFEQNLPFFMSGADGLTPFELLERIGVRAPSKEIMAQLGLGADVVVGLSNHAQVMTFLYAYRWEILKVCRSNRIALHHYLREHGLKDGSRVALVDVGWSGTTQEAFEKAVEPLMQIEVHGYYLCLADTPERKRRASIQNMTALITSENVPVKTISKIYANRVAVELLFSAPHPSVMGLEVRGGKVEPVFDRGRGCDISVTDATVEITKGIEAFSRSYAKMAERLNLHLSPIDWVKPVLELIDDRSAAGYRLMSEVRSFDAWGSSGNHTLSLNDYA